MPKSGEPKLSKETKKESTFTEKGLKNKIDIDTTAEKDKKTKPKMEKSIKTKKTEKVIDTTEKEKVKKENAEKKKKPVKSKETKTITKKEQLPEKKKQIKNEEVKSVSFSNKINDKALDKENLKVSRSEEGNSFSTMIPQNASEKSKSFYPKKKEFQTLEVVILIILTCIISLTVGGLLGIKFKERNVADKNIEMVGEEIQEFLKNYNYLVENYYGDIDKKELLNTAFKSMVDSLEDSYSGSIDENTSNNFDIELKGDYEGLGIEIINDNEKNILIYGIIPNSPASKADIKIGDKLLTVNNQDVKGMTTTEFIKNIVKGSGATEFEMVLERDGAEHTVTIKKEAITLESVTSKIYYEGNKRIAYIKVSIFAENTYNQFKKELTKLESDGFESLIIDLRDNSGGHLTAVKDMIGLFLDSSHVIYQTEDKKGKEKVYSNGKVTKNYPIVIVGNANSASASEVMIGALTEEYGAVLIGNRTFGKGTVQELHSLTNGDEYKFTTKKWLTPKGNWVHNNGIEPKIEVTLSKEYYENPTEENDNQLKAAINYLTGIK